MRLRLLTLYPDRMNIYADRGNAMFLRRRCEWRGIGFEESTAGIDEPIDPSAHDLVYIGGGQDTDQREVAVDLAGKRPALEAARDLGAVILGVCGGYQLLGSSYRIDRELVPGLGLLDLETVREGGPRLIGNIAIEVADGDGTRVVAGFENHGGRTRLGSGAEPFGRVLAGHGNNGEDGTEGARAGNVIGTYLHGPLLPKNPWLADHLIGQAIGSGEGDRPELAPLDDRLESAAHRVARAAALSGR